MHKMTPVALLGLGLWLILTPAGRANELRQMTDDTGRVVQIPAAPRRIVVLHEPLLGVPMADLGIAPVGSRGRDDAGASLMSVDFYNAVLGPRAPHPLPLGIGPVAEIDMERLAALKPDLIVGTERDAPAAERLSSVAPVYLEAASAPRGAGFRTETDLAALLGGQTALDARRAEYRATLDPLRSRVPQARQPGTTPTYLAVYLDDQVNVVTSVSGVTEAMADLGYERLALPASSGPAGTTSALIVPLSTEVFATLDPDMLIVMNSFLGDTRGEADIRAKLDRLTPGWERFLPAAREGRMVFVDSAQVSTPSIASAEHMLAAYQAWLSAQPRAAASSPTAGRP